MPTRKEIKQRAHKNVKKHWALFIIICLIASFLGSEYTNGLNILNLSGDINKKSNLSESLTSLNGLGDTDVMLSVLANVVTGKPQKGQEISSEVLKKHKEDTSNRILSRQAGVLASIVNNLDSGSFILVIYHAAFSMFGSANLAIALLVLLSLLFIIFLYFFIKQVYVVITRRLFLEARIYDAVPIQRFMFLARVKRWSRTALTMFLSFLFKFLWSFTIVGFPIKYYSYYMVPYIIAENPEIPSMEAIRLSTRMMRGHKWDCFVFHLSFLLWELLDFCTIGLLGLFYLNAYKTAAFCEYYAQLRSLAIEQQLEGYTYLNDRYLFELADDELIASAYADVIPFLDKPEPELTTPHILQNILTKWFGVIPFHNKEEIEYEEQMAQQLRMAKWKTAASRLSYPGRLSPRPEDRRRKNVEILYYVRNYSIPSLILIFFSFSFIGWLWEVLFHLVTDGVFVNRGVMHGPWLPIYGSGSLLILLLLKKFREHPLTEFIAGTVLCGIVEYMTAVFLEYTNDGQRWWDYTGYFLNLNGRVCAEGLLVFGLGGIVIVYIAAPFLDNLYRKFSQRILISICIVLIALFTVDFIYSSSHPNTGFGITDYEVVQNKGNKTPPKQPAEYSLNSLNHVYYDQINHLSTFMQVFSE